MMLAHNAEVFAEHTDEERTCICFEPVITAKELARAYVPIQFICGLYQDDISLIKGTVFPELYRRYDKDIRSKCGVCIEGQN